MKRIHLHQDKAGSPIAPIHQSEAEIKDVVINKRFLESSVGLPEDGMITFATLEKGMYPV